MLGFIKLVLNMRNFCLTVSHQKKCTVFGDEKITTNFDLPYKVNIEVLFNPDDL